MGNSRAFLNAMRNDYPKHIKKLIRQFVEKAYEREMHLELEKLETNFTAWRAGEISVHELNNLIHRYHNGISRELYVKYTSHDSPQDMLLAYAIVTGILPRAEVPDELVEALARQIWFYEDLKQRDNLRLPGE